MKKKSRKELEAIVSRLIANTALLEQKIASYNTLFAMYVKYKDESDDFQTYLKEKLEKKDG
tara:strand:+ start:428 stop:610 length:183 start_codon:yes stop_codon:yes gene_type:complete